MADDRLFFRPPADTTISTRASSKTGTSSSKSSRGIGPSNWHSRNFDQSLLNNDGPPLYTGTGHAGLELRDESGGGTVSVGVPETPKTGAGSLRSSGFGWTGTGGERMSRWMEEGDRMEFPVPPGQSAFGDSHQSAFGDSHRRDHGRGEGGGQRDSIISVASGNSK